MSRVDALRLEMASAVRQLGGEGKAKQQNRAAARSTGLDVSTIERLRWKKIKRIPADIADVIRERVATRIAEQQTKQEAKARHEIAILAARLEILETRVGTINEDFFGGETLPALQSLRRGGSLAGPGASKQAAGEAK